jgi:hypothetical protein
LLASNLQIKENRHRAQKNSLMRQSIDQQVLSIKLQPSVWGQNLRFLA